MTAVAIAVFALLDLVGFLQGLAVVVGLAAVLAVGSSKRKDATIGDLEKALKGKDERLEETKAQLDGASRRADEAEKAGRRCSDEVIHWKAKYDEQERYTARGALETVAERLGSLEHTIVSAITNQGELILKNTELASNAVQALQRVAIDLEKIELRLAVTDPPKGDAGAEPAQN
jgi:chromosome segregation ATPase